MSNRLLLRRFLSCFGWVCSVNTGVLLFLQYSRLIELWVDTEGTGGAGTQVSVQLHRENRQETRCEYCVQT
jgi:hypothetical protein